MTAAASEGVRNGITAGRRRRGQSAEGRQVKGRLNNFMSFEQRLEATRTYRRRMTWYHGPDWPRDNVNTGYRLEKCIEELAPEVLERMRRDLFGGFALGAERWSLTELIRGAWGLRWPLWSPWPGEPIYDVVFARGTLTIRRCGVLLAEIPLESEEQWAAGEATLNPTGGLDEAPPGALRILCVCSLGLATGVEMRMRAETILLRMGVDAWLEVAGSDQAEPRTRLADLVMVTTDDAAAVRSRSHASIAVLDKHLDLRDMQTVLADVAAGFLAADR